jgi:hypothetical protein
MMMFPVSEIVFNLNLRGLPGVSGQRVVGACFLRLSWLRLGLRRPCLEKSKAAKKRIAKVSEVVNSLLRTEAVTSAVPI